MRHKYNARSTTFNGYKFDSVAEAEVYKKLLALERAGKIHDLRVHPTFELQKPFVDHAGKRQRAIAYEADFYYIEPGTPLPVVCEVKGAETEAWKIKKKLFLYRYPEYELRIIR